MLKIIIKRHTSFSVLALFFVCVLRAQTPSSNADIVKMIQAGLPESTIVNKIHEGTGHWDTSVDALILLKNAGATEAELGAMTELPVAQVATQPPAPVMVMGGYLENHDGDISYFFPGASPTSQMRFHLVLADGQPALRMYTPVCCDGRHEIFGDLLVTREKTVFSLYGIRQDDNIVENPKPHESYVFPMQGLELRAGLGRWYYHLANKSDKGEKRLEIPLTLPDVKDDAVPSVIFFRSLLATFDSTMATLLRAAGISDPDNQIVESAHFQSATEQPLSVRLAESTSELRFNLAEGKRVEMALKNGPHSNGNGILAFANAMQGAANMQQAIQQGNIAAANHDMAGQLNAAVNAGTAEVNTFQAVSNPTTPLQTTTSPVPNGIPNALAQQQANIAAAQTQTAKPQQTASAQSPFRFNPTQPASPAVPNSGTVPPPTCVDLGPGNCMPIAQYKELQAQKLAAQQAAAANTGICQASGFIPGAMTHPAADVALGVQCTPRQPYITAGRSSAGNPSSTATSGGGTGCQNVNTLVQVDSNWFQADIADKEVVAYVTNHATTKVTCTIAFDGGGQWVDYGTGTYKVGTTHVGGQGNGLWHMGAASPVVHYACFAGDTPTDTKGNPCNANMAFPYP